jgi:hypothetical protein|nr:MAG TPA: hypothetical protein [Caudoviricetes sp.]DAT43545.1 MAG TPA: hypothetical protein [Caudoviricetes sp.]
MVEVLKEFFDLKENVIRKVGTTFEADEARQKELMEKLPGFISPVVGTAPKTTEEVVTQVIEA